MPFRRKPLILAVAIAIFFVIAITGGVALFFSPLLTKYVESDAFRIKMEEETAKGLHFPRGRYARIRRTGAFTEQSDRFEADNGRKAMRSLDAHGITAKFNPWGMFCGSGDLMMCTCNQAKWRSRFTKLIRNQ